MIRRIYYTLFILVSLLFGNSDMHAQELLEDEKAMFKEARKAYTAGEFVEALRLFSHLSSVDNKNTIYQYYLGISFLNAKDDRSKVIEYLEFAATNPETPDDVHFYLAKVYHLANRFDDAIASYDKFKGMIKKSDSRITSIDRQIEMCNNAKIHVQNHQKVLMASKKKISNAPAYGHYNISALGGKVIRTPDHYKSKEDVKNNLNDILFMAYNKDKLFYTSKDDGGQGGKDIFVVKQLPNKEWALPQNIGKPINSPYDEDSPFLHPNGKTLYFSSEGHNSMGGYDIFRSEFVVQEWPKKGYWSKPQNLGYPINSEGDDKFFIADFDQEYAYFSSGRETNPGRMEVYKIKLPKTSISNTVVKGLFTNNNDVYPNKVKISIVDKITDELVGVFNTDPMNGEFLLIIPPGRDYTYLIEADGFMPRVQDITIPAQFTFYPIYQEISLNGTKLSEDLAFVNDFSNPYIEMEVDEGLEEEFKVAGSVGRQEFASTFAYEDRNKMQAIQLANRIVMIPASDHTSIAAAGTKEVELVTSAPIGEKTQTDFSDGDLESVSIVDNQSEIIAQNEGEQQSDVEYAEADEYEKISLGTIVMGDDAEPSIAQAEPSIDVIVAFAEELRSSSQQNAIDAEIAFNNAKELKAVAEEFKAEAAEAEKELESISSDKEKEQKLEEVKELEAIAREKWQEARQSYDYAQDLKKEAGRKAAKANEATVITEKIRTEQKKKRNKSVEEFVYTDEQLQQIELYSHEYSRELKSEANQKEQKATIAFDYSNKLKQQAFDMYDEADQIIADADDLKDESEKEAEIKRGEQMKEKAEDLK
ncbi:MAG: PD40 domain-containing protein, partial [Bacteroidia bacterium]|nr:PD40 domain-containing protein [Bacteroidia bacterium]